MIGLASLSPGRTDGPPTALLGPHPPEGTGCFPAPRVGARARPGRSQLSPGEAGNEAQDRGGGCASRGPGHGRASPVRHPRHGAAARPAATDPRGRPGVGGAGLARREKVSEESGPGRLTQARRAVARPSGRGQRHGAPGRAEEPSRQGRCRCPGAGSPCGQGKVLLPAVISVLAVSPINSISACDTSVEGSSACHARLKQDPVLPFAPSPVFSSFRIMTIMTPMLVPRSSFRVKAIPHSAVPDNLSFLTVARSLSLMLYSIDPLSFFFF